MKFYNFTIGFLTFFILAVLYNAQPSFGLHYGQLILIGKQKFKMDFNKRAVANGIKQNPKYTKIMNKLPHSPFKPPIGDHEETYSITFSFDNNEAKKVVAEYGLDPDRDMFQIGREIENIDFTIDQKRVSRYACRIVAEREAPENVYIYAAGFDNSKNIFLGVNAMKIKKPDGQFDGLVTNGVLILSPFNEPPSQEAPPIHENAASSSHALESLSSRIMSPIKRIMKPLKKISRESSPRAGRKNKSSQESTPITGKEKEVSQEIFHSTCWKEVSVTGDIYSQRKERVPGQMGKFEPSLTNKLEDGTLINLCGATLLWRSAKGLQNIDTEETLKKRLQELNKKRAQCPVYMHTLVFGRTGESSTSNSNNGHSVLRKPHVYEKCGHVQSNHKWGIDNGKYKCPYCKQSSDRVIKMSLGLEPAFHLDSNAFDYAFNSCGHIASERTVEYWSSIPIPQENGNFHAVCPFCNTLLNDDKPTIKLILCQD
uniref:Uncharacterized protein n=1 Tax=Globodera rostochiensis TaxID=31243 RepID=A0A914HN62_GLORO